MHFKWAFGVSFGLTVNWDSPLTHMSISGTFFYYYYLWCICITFQVGICLFVVKASIGDYWRANAAICDITRRLEFHSWIWTQITSRQTFKLSSSRISSLWTIKEHHQSERAAAGPGSTEPPGSRQRLSALKASRHMCELFISRAFTWAGAVASVPGGGVRVGVDVRDGGSPARSVTRLWFHCKTSQFLGRPRVGQWDGPVGGFIGSCEIAHDARCLVKKTERGTDRGRMG